MGKEDNNNWKNCVSGNFATVALLAARATLLDVEMDLGKIEESEHKAILQAGQKYFAEAVVRGNFDALAGEELTYGLYVYTSLSNAGLVCCITHGAGVYMLLGIAEVLLEKSGLSIDSMMKELVKTQDGRGNIDEDELLKVLGESSLMKSIGDETVTYRGYDIKETLAKAAGILVARGQ